MAYSSVGRNNRRNVCDSRVAATHGNPEWAAYSDVKSGLFTRKGQFHRRRNPEKSRAVGILRPDVSKVSPRLTCYALKATNKNRACSLKGHAPIALIETYQDIDQRIALFARISPTLRFQLKLNGLVVRCTSAVLQNGLRSMSKDQEHSLDVLIRVFEASLRDIEREATSGK
jgi:hypothetical protein